MNSVMSRGVIHILKRLRFLRERAGISQKALAEKIGVSQQSINKYENHNIEPDIETLIALADIFDTSVDYLIGRTEAPEALRSGAECTLDSAEYSLICKYRALHPRQRECIQFIMDNFL